MSLLIICDYYLPGTRSGGPVSSIYGLSNLFNEMNVSCQIFTRNKDWGKNKSYTSNKSNSWLNTEYGRVYYASSPIRLINVLLRQKPKSVILNSVFSRFTIMTFLVFIISKNYIGINNIFLYPRGEFNDKALANSYFKKTYLKFFFKPISRSLGVKFIVTSELERRDLLGKKLRVIANLPNFPRLNRTQNISSFANTNRLLFVGRLDPIKGLKEFILSVPKHKIIHLDLVGPVGDVQYFEELSVVAKRARTHGMKVTFLGYKSWLELTELYPKYSYIVLPSHTENFGHSLFESMSYGLVPLISTGVPYSAVISQTKSGYIFDHKTIVEDLDKIFNDIESLSKDDYLTKQSLNSHQLKSTTSNVKIKTKKFYELYI